MNENNAPTYTNEAALTAIEFRIRQRRDNVTREFYAIGDELNEAKARGIVPHGQWEQWATEVTGLSIRAVQRLMQAAREVPAEQRASSSLGQLEFRQLSAVLSLPEGEREAMADKALAEGMTSRQVEAAIAKAREEATKAADKRQAALRDENNRLRMEMERKAEELAAEIAEDDLTQAAKRAEDAEQALAASLHKVAELETRITTTADSPAKDAELQALRAQLQQANDYASKQAALRAAAQNELLSARSQMARGQAATEGDASLTLGQFVEASRTFVARCAVLPHMRAQLMSINKADREAWESTLAMVQQLLDGAREALDTVDGGVIHG